MAIIWCMASEIRRAIEIIFCHFGTFLTRLPFSGGTISKFQKIEKKKTTGDIIILQMCTINDNMMYGSWDMEFNNQTFLSFWTVFCLFTQNGPRKSNFWKNEKKHLEILSFYKCEPWMIIIWCMVSEIRSTTDRIFCHFRLFFCPFIPLTTPKIKILKK